MNLRTPARIGGAILAVSILVAAAGWFLLVSGQRSEASRLEETLTAARAELTKKQTEVQAQRGIAGVAPANVLERALPDDTQMADVMDELSGLAEATGVTFATVTPSTPVASTGYTVTPLETQFRGTWSQISDFVSRLRKLVAFKDGRLKADGRLYSIRKIDLSEGENEFPNLNATMTVDVFQYSPAAAASAPAAAAQTTTPAAS